MKANEIPEKIFISYETDEDGYIYPDYMWHKHQFEDMENIEYTRTDAFIDKACEYFYRCLEDTKVTDDYRNTVVPGIQAIYTSVEEFVEDFKNYIKA